MAFMAIIYKLYIMVNIHFIELSMHETPYIK